MSAPFVERHRPEDLESIVLPSEIKDRLRAFALTGDLPQSCIFYGSVGLGKTTSALALIKEYYVKRGIYPPETTLEQIRANSPRLLEGVFVPSLFVASRTQGTIDFIRETFTRFLQGAPPAAALKLVVFDEADAMSEDAKEALLPLIERFSGSRIIFTTNEEPVFGLGPAIVSRAAGCTYEFTKPSKEEVMAHLKKIADKEGVKLSEDAFQSIADTAKDVREAVGMLGSDIALVRAKEEKKPKVEAIPFMAGAKIYYYASYNRPYSVVELRQDIDGGTLVMPRSGKIEFGEPFVIIQRSQPLPEEAIKSLELKQIPADKIPSWWATAIRTEFGKEAPERAKFPPIPKEGITEEWIEEVLRIDPFVKPIATRKRAGEYEIEFQKTINGEPLTLAVQEKLTFALTRDTLLEGKMDSMRWSGKDVTIPAMWEEDEERFEKTYTKEELESLIARGLTLTGLQDIARIKGLETKGKVNELVDRIAGLPSPKEATPPMPSRTREEAKPPARARIADADAKTLEENFRAEMALRGIPLKSSTTDYLAVFKAYLREATTKSVSPDRFKSNWLPNIVSSIEEVYSNRTTVATQEVTRRIINADAKFKRDDIIDYNGQLKRVTDLRLNQDTGTYEYQLEGVEGMVDESILKTANIPRAKWNVGDNLVYADKGYLVQDRSFNSETRKWEYRLKLILTRVGEMG